MRIKDCPHCGRKARYVVTNIKEWIECISCQATSMKVEHAKHSPYKYVAVNAWNKRAGADEKKSLSKWFPGMIATAAKGGWSGLFLVALLFAPHMDLLYQQA